MRPLDLTVPRYACLELLGQRPGLSGAELARCVFVTRQSMHGVRRGLHDRGLLTRPPNPAHGRALPTALTTTGRQQLTAASTAVRAVERQMLDRLPPAQQTRLREDLASCTTALAPPSRADAIGMRELSRYPDRIKRSGTRAGLMAVGSASGVGACYG